MRGLHMKILSIGNSFSQDAHRYLYRLAKADGTNLKTVNLHIGGCPLQKHYINMLDDNAAYDFEFNGEKTGIKVSIREALVSDNWDFITLQQASPVSGKYETYSPYLEALAAYVRKYCPHTKILIHQTWAYEDGSEKLMHTGFASAKEMLSAVRDSYSKAVQSIKADGMIPCGEAMMHALNMGLEKVHRDTFHASLGAGRYLLALCWYKFLTKKDVTGNAFNEFDVPVTQEEREIIIRAVNEAVK
ncbi:MAG: DUF4886 domain-containing protein [Ruminococcaceae bacterium]|nr:DUF4886 domain-containing protein [Oscillospiraceae bacterium]